MFTFSRTQTRIRRKSFKYSHLLPITRSIGSPGSPGEAPPAPPDPSAVNRRRLSDNLGAHRPQTDSSSACAVPEKVVFSVAVSDRHSRLEKWRAIRRGRE